MPTEQTIELIEKGPGRWDYNLAVSEGLAHQVVFTLPGKNREIEVLILQSGICAPNVHTFVGITTVDSDGNFGRSPHYKLVWVGGVYEYGAKTRSYVENYGPIDEIAQPHLPGVKLDSIRRDLIRIFRVPDYARDSFGRSD